MKVVAMIAARMASRRLYGKVLRPILGVPLLEQMMRRLSRCSKLDEIVIVTSWNPADEEVVDFAKKKGCPVGRGSEEDVLGRYYQVAKEREADVVVRLTGDCPLIDPTVTETVVERHLVSRKRDLTSNIAKRTFPRGLDTEVLSFSCLERIHEEAKDPIYREHVTNYIYDHPDQFSIENVAGEKDLSDLRICVDTEEDFELVARIYETLFPSNPLFGLEEIVELIDHHPDLRRINESVVQAKIFKFRTEP